MTVVGVAWHGSDESMQDFVSRHGITFANVIDDDGALFADFGVPYQPAWVFVDADGNVETSLGAKDESELTESLDALVTGG